MKLYRITAHGSGKDLTYYVVAKTTTEAEEAVAKLHTAEGWFAPTHYDAAQLATTGGYGQPDPLILPA